MGTEGLLDIKQYITSSLERQVDDLMERVEQEVQDEVLESLLIPMIANVRAASEVTRQLLAVEAEVATHRELQEQLAEAGSHNTSALSGQRADAAQERLDVLTEQLRALKDRFDV